MFDFLKWLFWIFSAEWLKSKRSSLLSTFMSVTESQVIDLDVLNKDLY